MTPVNPAERLLEQTLAWYTARLEQAEATRDAAQQEASRQTLLARDHLALLKKYIDHVGNCEGVDFLGSGYGHADFTPEEWALLQQVRS